MKNEHLNEIEIQQYVLDKDSCDINIIAHIDQCPKCKIEIEIYELLFAEIKKQPDPVFEFDITNLVMLQLPQKQKFSFDKYVITLLSGVLISLLSVLIYLTNQYFPTVFNGISSIQFSLIMVTMILISIFIYIDMNKDYKNQMNFS